MTAQTISVTEFKAKCLRIFDQLAAHELDEVQITRRGKVVGVLKPPAADRVEWDEWVLSMRGSVIMPPDFDPTAPVCDEVWDAELGIIHR